jgi:hypothetical protein
MTEKILKINFQRELSLVYKITWNEWSKTEWDWCGTLRQSSLGQTEKTLFETAGVPDAFRSSYLKYTCTDQVCFFNFSLLIFPWWIKWFIHSQWKEADRWLLLDNKHRKAQEQRQKKSIFKTVSCHISDVEIQRLWHYVPTVIFRLSGDSTPSDSLLLEFLICPITPPPVRLHSNKTSPHFHLLLKYSVSEEKTLKTQENKVFAKINKERKM